MLVEGTNVPSSQQSMNRDLQLLNVPYNGEQPACTIQFVKVQCRVKISPAGDYRRLHAVGTITCSISHYSIKHKLYQLILAVAPLLIHHLR
jgi:hypothetical protein